MQSDNMSTTIIIVIIFIVFLYYVFSPQTPMQNKGTLVTSSSRNANVSDADADSTYTYDSVSLSMNNQDDSNDSSIENIRERAMGRNNLFFRRRDGAKYKNNSYKDLDSGSLKDVEKQYGVQDVKKNYTDRYMPIDESNGEGAPIDLSGSKNSDADKYNVNSFLPQEEEKDWFETIEQVDVKNSNLINIYRPIGANTIGSSQKAASYDIRGYADATCPKFVVSPWLQSSYEPDRSNKGLC